MLTKPGSRSRGQSLERRLSIRDLAEEFGCTHRTIRFYEDRGLLSPQRQGQNRIFSGRDRARLSLILRGRRLGFSLTEIGEMLDLYDADPGHVTQLKAAFKSGRERIAQLERQRADIDAALTELKELDAMMSDMLREKGIACDAAAPDRSEAE